MWYDLSHLLESRKRLVLHFGTSKNPEARVNRHFPRERTNMTDDRLATWGLALLIAHAMFLCGCADRPEAQTRADAVAPSSEPIAPDTAAESAAQQQQFEERLLEIAGSYESYGRVHVDYRWALTLCVPSDFDLMFLPELAFSDTSDSRAHGRKLYALYAKMSREPHQYLVEEPSNPVGQVVVKESWIPEELEPDDVPRHARPDSEEARPDDSRSSPAGTAVSQTIFHDGRLFRPKTKADLFIMLKLEPGTPGTDEGWVYGIVTGDGKKVISAGCLASCMRCHLEAPHDRLFGPHLPPQ
jgi:hypothetical protein